MSSIKAGSLTAALVGITAQLVFSQAWTSAYTSSTATGDCKGLPASLNSGFTVTPIVSRAVSGAIAPTRVLKMAFYQQPTAQNSDIYIIEKGAAASGARILYYNGADGSLTSIGKLANVNYGGGGVEEQGLVGIALNQKTFATDNFLYLFYCSGAASIGSPTVGFKVSRFTLSGATKQIDLNSEKVLLHIPAGTSGRWHTGGAMHFDNEGNLYISVADNEALLTGPANTADLRGSILRIKPDASNPKGYTIPAGNFGEYWSQQFQGQSKAALAAEYADTNKVKPEIYIKGVRNVYSFSVDAARPGMVEYSQCGPDAQRGETYSITTKPAFGGWPFWVYASGNVVRQSTKAGNYDEAGEPSGTEWAALNPASMSTNTPVNSWSGNKGVDTLPPYHTPFHGVGTPGSCAAGGPIIRYNGAITNPGQMPPHLDNTVMFSDFQVSAGVNSIWAVKLNPTTGTTTGTPTQVFTMARSGRPSLLNSVDFQQGPDGALYMIDWGEPCCKASPDPDKGGISRITYTGTCKDPNLVTVSATPRVLHPNSVPWFKVKSGRLVLTDLGNGLIENGSHAIRIMDMNGKILHNFEGQGAASYEMPRLTAGKLYVLRAETPVGISQRTFSGL